MANETEEIAEALRDALGVLARHGEQQMSEEDFGVALQRGLVDLAFAKLCSHLWHQSLLTLFTEQSLLPP